MKEAPLKRNPRIDQFKQLMREGIKSFEDAGIELVKILDGDKTSREELLDDEELTPDIIDTFERIGRKQLFYRLCLHEGPGVKALRACPFSDQVRHADEPIEMLLLCGGKTESLLVSVWAMTPAQAKQIFNGHRIRSLGEQRAWLEGQRCKPKNIAIDRPYTVKRGKVEFHPHNGFTLTVQQLALLLSEAAE